MKIIIITDNWKPQVNGVVRALEMIIKLIREMGHKVLVIEPGMFLNAPLLPYPEIRLSLVPPHVMAELIENFNPDVIHIATEGPLGWAARRYCLNKEYPFTTMLHTRLPEYIRIYLRSIIGDREFTEKWAYFLLKKFHKPAFKTLVSTKSMKGELGWRGFRSLVVCPFGYDQDQFYPRKRQKLPGKPPIFMYMGRVAKEKNLEAFLDLKLDGTKYVVGDGPARKDLKKRYPNVVFTGKKRRDALAEHLSNADVFVFPSKTDTFGLVMIEALACGTPVVSFPVAGAKDIIKNGVNGYMDNNLARAAKKALRIPRKNCPRSVEHFTWKKCVEIFLENQAFITDKPEKE